jgi:hypothetical protein
LTGYLSPKPITVKPELIMFLILNSFQDLDKLA